MLVRSWETKPRSLFSCSEAAEWRPETTTASFSWRNGAGPLTMSKRPSTKVMGTEASFSEKMASVGYITLKTGWTYHSGRPRHKTCYSRPKMKLSDAMTLALGSSVTLKVLWQIQPVQWMASMTG